MSDKNREGLKRISVFASILVYIAFVAYSEFHFWNLVSSFVPPDFQVLGVVAVAASAISALALPVALHFWCREGVQRIVAWGFTIVHLLIVFANLVLDSATISGASVSDEFINIYAVYVLPGTVAFYALGWLLVWASDTDVQRAEQARETREAEEDGRWKLRKIIAEEKTRALESAFQSDHAKRKIDRYAGRVAPRILAEELGMSPEELGVEEGEVWNFWDVTKKNLQDAPIAPPTPTNGANGHPEQMHLDAPRNAHNATQGQQRSDLPPAGNGRAPGSGRPKASSRPVVQSQPVSSIEGHTQSGRPIRSQPEPVNKERLWSNGSNTIYRESYCPSCRQHVAAGHVRNLSCSHCGVWIREATELEVLREGNSRRGVVLDQRLYRTGAWLPEKPTATHTNDGAPLSLDGLDLEEPGK